ncbi:MAG: hypothetical protein AAF513_05015 [Pseudomonadota bacterium]
MSLADRNTKTIIGVILELVANGKTEFRTGDVNSVLRERNSPMGTWEVRAEFSKLEQAGQIACDADSGLWHATEALQNAG